jgi:site-specific recombinase XerD
LPVSRRGNRITYDGDEKGCVKGFGIRVTKGGACSFVLNYRTRAGRERRYTIGQFPNWSTVAARAEAARLRQRIDLGEDPLAEVQEQREAPTMADLCARFMREHVANRRPSTCRNYQLIIDNDILATGGWRARKVADITFEDVAGLHSRITERAPYMANRMLAVLSKMFALAIRWRIRTDNPVKGVERNQELKRQRYLTTAEIAALSETLSRWPDQQGADIIRLLMFTGARRNEVLAARWDQIDFETGVWTKPGAMTKQKIEHRVPLSVPARQLLSDIRSRAGGADYVFPGRRGHGHRGNINNEWAKIRKAAGLDSARLHDLRHTYASILASAGQSLPIIGALLGHTQPGTTARYAHLFDDPLRAATERVGAIITGVVR